MTAPAARATRPSAPRPTAPRLSALHLYGWVLALMLGLAMLPAAAEAKAWWLGGMVGGAEAQVAPTEAPPAEAAAPAGPDYDAWSKAAVEAEAMVEDGATPSDRLETMRETVAAWREKFAAAQTANAPRIASLREQITALGEPPAEGASEPAEIATRRVELAEALARAQAPGLTAEEAYRRADGLVREADRILRARDASKLLRHDPAPLNPGNWPAAVRTVTSFATDLWTELRQGWANAPRRAALTDAAPVIAIGLVLALLLIWQGRRWIEQLINRLQDRLPRKWWGVIELPLSLAQIALPLLAVYFLSVALTRTEFFGPLGRAIVSTGMPQAVFLMLVVFWIGRNTFPRDDRLTPILRLSPEHVAEARVHVGLYALVLAAEALTRHALTVRGYGLAVNIATYPLLVLSGTLLFRLGQILQRSAELEISEKAEGPPSFRSNVLALLAKAAMAIGVLGPLLGALGYLTLGDALVRPAMASLGLLAIVALLQRLIHDLYALVTRASSEDAENALIPVLLAFALVLVAAPLLALIWGMRSADLLEYWGRFRDGFQIGQSRVSPLDFLLFAVVFGVGYGLTQLLQRGLQTTILPKTRLDTGGKNAILSGVRYIGLFLAGLAAITSTGLDLSNLAIVAGALSVGIGFGLQNIVQNFVSGIILLIERPVAEGDWVEVGGVQGIVRGISFRSTRVETFDRTTVIVPNASLISGQVTNVTGFTLSGRLVVPVTVGFTSDTRKIEKILREVAEAQPLVVLTPPPMVPLVSYGAGLMNFEIRMILRDVNFATGVKSEILHQLIQRFAAADIDVHPILRENRTLVQLCQPEPTEAAGDAPAQDAQPPAAAPVVAAATGQASAPAGASPPRPAPPQA